MKKSMIFIFAIVAMLGFATMSLAADMTMTDKKPVKAASTKKTKKAKSTKPVVKPAAQSTATTTPETISPAVK